MLGIFPNKTLFFKSVAPKDLQRASHLAPCSHSHPPSSSPLPPRRCSSPASLRGQLLPPGTLLPASTTLLTLQTSPPTEARLPPARPGRVPLPLPSRLSVRLLPAAELAGGHQGDDLFSIWTPPHRDSVASCLATGQEPGLSHQAACIQRCSTNDKLGDHGQFHFTSL